MPNLLWAVQVLRGTQQDGNVLDASTTVYANTEQAAKINGAAALGVKPHQVTVQQIPAYNPTDDELRREWAEGGVEQSLKDLGVQGESTGGGAYG